MDATTYRALKRLMGFVARVSEYFDPQYLNDVKQINTWLDEVRKEFDN